MCHNKLSKFSAADGPIIRPDQGSRSAKPSTQRFTVQDAQVGICPGTGSV